MLSDLRLATVPRVLPDAAVGVFKDSYLLNFLDLPETHSEADLQAGLLMNLRKFLMELVDGFAFVGEKFVSRWEIKTLSWICSFTIATFSVSLLLR